MSPGARLIPGLSWHPWIQNWKLSRCQVTSMFPSVCPKRFKLQIGPFGPSYRPATMDRGSRCTLINLVPMTTSMDPCTRWPPCTQYPGLYLQTQILGPLPWTQALAYSCGHKLQTYGNGPRLAPLNPGTRQPPVDPDSRPDYPLT